MCCLKGADHISYVLVVYFSHASLVSFIECIYFPKKGKDCPVACRMFGDKFMMQLPGMRLLLDQYKQMTVEMGNPRKFVPHCQVFSSGNMPGKGNQKGKRPKPLQAQHFMNSAENKPPTIPFSSEKTNSSRLRGSYILGNSDFGKNFITYLGSKPIYYGVTKESHRSRYKKR